jgi:hypothetical protein
MHSQVKPNRASNFSMSGPNQDVVVPSGMLRPWPKLMTLPRLAIVTPASFSVGLIWTFWRSNCDVEKR